MRDWSVRSLWRNRRLTALAAVVAVLSIFILIFVMRGRPAIQTTECTIPRYKNMKIPISSQENVSKEDAKQFAGTVLQEMGYTELWTKNDFKEHSDGVCDSRTSLEKMIFDSLREEAVYEREMEKRQGVLAAILAGSTFADPDLAKEDRERQILDAVFERERMELTEEEQSLGILKLMEVYGVRTEEALLDFLSQEEQQAILRKEKVYEFLLEENKFVSVSPDPAS